MPIYFDHSATTPVDPAVLSAMLPYFSEKFGNASSIHTYGQTAAVAVDEARLLASRFFGCRPTEVIFTSGATEANNIAIKGLIKGLKLKGVEKPHVITSAVEHDAVLEPINNLAAAGEIEATIAGVDERGVINLEYLKSIITDQTALISVMYVNSEVGTIQPIAEIGKLVAEVNAARQAIYDKLPTGERTTKPAKLYFHTDATQAVNFLDCNIDTLGVDMLSMSAHKIYGPKGSGALIVKSGLPISALVHGGHHERNLRSGTLNVPGIVGLAKALELISETSFNHNKQIKEVRDYLIERVIGEITGAKLTTAVAVATPAHAHIVFNGAEGESILMALDLDAGIAVSTGSACASNTLGASKVLLAMGIKQEDTHGAIRFSLGKDNTKAEVDELMQHLPDIVQRFRAMAPDLTPFAGRTFAAEHHEEEVEQI
ncbi:MAG: cysteine desulfurase family protein [Candidatus Falkowbacteria bacterium]